MLVKIKRLPNLRELPLPEYKTAGAVARDLAAAIDAPITLKPMEIAKVPTGIAIELPFGKGADVRPRSGLASKGIVTHLGLLDFDYRGEIFVVIQNFSGTEFVIERGHRIAQLYMDEHFEWNEVAELTSTARGEGGFGSTKI